MFSRKDSKPAAKPEPPKGPTPQELLRECVDRNSACGLVRLEGLGEDPPATGRLIRWDERGMRIESVQVIGGDVRVRVGDRVQGSLKHKDTVLCFECTVKDIGKLEQLNEKRYVDAIELTPPLNIVEGNRRMAYRASLSAHGTDFPASVWFLNRHDPETNPGANASTDLGTDDSGETPSTRYGTSLSRAMRSTLGLELPDVEPDWPAVIEDAKVEREHARVQITDLSPNGLGLVMYGIKAMQLQPFERIVLATDLLEQRIELVAEVRRMGDLPGDSCRVGVLLIHPTPGMHRHPTRLALEQIFRDTQRAMMKRRAA